MEPPTPKFAKGKQLKSKYRPTTKHTRHSKPSPTQHRSNGIPASPTHNSSLPKNLIGPISAKHTANSNGPPPWDLPPMSLTHSMSQYQTNTVPCPRSPHARFLSRFCPARTAKEITKAYLVAYLRYQRVWIKTSKAPPISNGKSPISPEKPPCSRANDN